MKINVNELVNDVGKIQKQIETLESLMYEKKAVLEKYFEKTGKTKISGDECVVYVQERTNIDYDLDSLASKLNRETFGKIVDICFSVDDWKSFIKFLISSGISKKELKEYINQTKTVNQKKINECYEKGEISLEDISGCYTARIKKSVAVRSKKVNDEIELAE